jgi:hypothetical protein
MGGPETRGETRGGGRSVFTRVAKPMVEHEKPVFIAESPANPPAALHLRRF